MPDHPLTARPIDSGTGERVELRAGCVVHPLGLDHAEALYGQLGASIQTARAREAAREMALLQVPLFGRSHG